MLPANVPFDLRVVRPPSQLKARHRPYYDLHPNWGQATSLGYEAISEFPSMVALVLFSDVAADYYLREELVPNLAEQMRQTFGGTVAFYDDYRVLRKEAAVLAGLGQIGKNALFFSRKFGFNCKLDLFFTTVEFDCYGAQAENDWHLGPCATCDACIRACPVGAYIDFELVNVRACDEYINPNWNKPSQMCRACITSCPPSHSVLKRLYERGAPAELRLDGIDEGSEEGTSQALYRRIPSFMQVDEADALSVEAMPMLPLRYAYRERPLSAESLSCDTLFDHILPEAISSHAEAVRALGVCCQLTITGNGGGNWVLDLSSHGPFCIRGIAESPDCEIEFASQFALPLFRDFGGYSSYSLQLMRDGRYVVRGNVSASHQVQALLDLLRLAI